MAQLAAPSNKGLFQKAIIQSGIFTQIYPRNFGPPGGGSFSDLEKRGVNLFNFLGVKNLDEARAIPAKELMAKILENKGFWGTVVDNKFLKEDPYEAMRKGDALQVPILLGNTKDEFFSEPQVKDFAELKELAKTMFGAKADAYIALLKNAGGTSFANALHALKQAGRVNGIEYAVRLLAEGYKQHKVASPLYYYCFGPDIPGWDNPGCFHSSDIWFFFETLTKSWRPWKGEHYELARRMCNYWCDFIKNGDPNGADADGSAMPCWAPFTADAPAVMSLAEESSCAVKAPSPVMKMLVEAKK
jgi:para-nitrobenzyl esterase